MFGDSPWENAVKVAYPAMPNKRATTRLVKMEMCVTISHLFSVAFSIEP